MNRHFGLPLAPTTPHQTTDASARNDQFMAEIRELFQPTEGASSEACPALSKLKNVRQFRRDGLTVLCGPVALTSLSSLSSL